MPTKDITEEETEEDCLNLTIRKEGENSEVLTQQRVGIVTEDQTSAKRIRRVRRPLKLI